MQKFHAADNSNTFTDHNYLFMHVLLALLTSLNQNTKQVTCKPLFHFIRVFQFFVNFCLNYMIFQLLFKIQDLQLVYLVLRYRYIFSSAITAISNITTTFFLLLPFSVRRWKRGLPDRVFH